MIEGHGEGAAALGRAAQAGRIAEHFGQRNEAFDSGFAVFGFHAVDTSTTGVQATDNVAHVFFRYVDFDCHVWFEENWISFLRAILECHGACHFECHFGGVDIMIGTIINGNLDIDHRITSYNTVFESCFYAGLDRVDEFFRNDAANDFICEFESFARFHRFKTQPAVTVLAMTTGLTNEFTFGFNGFTDGFTVSDLRFAYGAVYVEFTSHTIDDDVEVEFAHAGDDGLVGFWIGVYFEGRIFFCQSLKSIAHLFLVSFGLWFNSNGNDRIREFHFFEDDRMIYIAEGIAGGDILEADCCSDIAGVSAVDFLNVRDWLKQYSINRYGKAPAQLMKAWDYLLKSVYGTFTDHPRFNWQFRPGLVKNGSINISDDYFKGLESFVAASEELKDSPYYLTDLCEMTAHYLGGKAEILTRQIDQEYLLGDTLQAHFLQSRFETFMLGMDRILSQHPTLRLDRWVSFASKAARTEAQRKQYEMNARRIVTVWGPPVDDYSARMWSGLVGSYYLGRWKEYYKGRDSGKSADLSSWERKWVEENRVYKKWNSDFDLIDFSRKMIGLSQDISSADLLLNRPAMIGTWSLARNSSKDLLFNIPARMLVGLNGVSLECLKGKGDIEVTGLVLEADGKVIYSSSDRVLSDEGILNLKLEIPANVTANNGCVLKLKIKSSTDSAAGIVICVNKKQS